MIAKHCVHCLGMAVEGMQASQVCLSVLVLVLTLVLVLVLMLVLVLVFSWVRGGRCTTAFVVEFAGSLGSAPHSAVNRH